MARILIIDDSRTSRRILKNIFTEDNHEIVAEATNGQEGYEKYIELKPDIVTLDITMPVLDGLGALDKIMTFDPDAKVIMITAAGQEKKVIEALQMGVKNFIVKPFKNEDIVHAVKECFE